MGMLWQKPEPPYSIAPLLTDDQRRSPPQLLSLCAGPCLATIQEGPPPGSALLSPSVHGVTDHLLNCVCNLRVFPDDSRGCQCPDTPGSPEGNTEGPGTASSEPPLPS